MAARKVVCFLTVIVGWLYESVWPLLGNGGVLCCSILLLIPPFMTCIGMHSRKSCTLRLMG